MNKLFVVLDRISLVGVIEEKHCAIEKYLVSVSRYTAVGRNSFPDFTKIFQIAIMEETTFNKRP